MADQRSAISKSDIPWTLGLIAVVLLVFVGFVRLLLDHWGYLVLILFALGAAYYLFTQLTSAEK
jgi:hypothetical protein